MTNISVSHYFKEKKASLQLLKVDSYVLLLHKTNQIFNNVNKQTNKQKKKNNLNTTDTLLTLV